MAPQTDGMDRNKLRELSIPELLGFDSVTAREDRYPRIRGDLDLVAAERERRCYVLGQGEYARQAEWL